MEIESHFSITCMESRTERLLTWLIVRFTLTLIHSVCEAATADESTERNVAFAINVIHSPYSNRTWFQYFNFSAE